jgi:hypothetical protein
MGDNILIVANSSLANRMQFQGIIVLGLNLPLAPPEELILMLPLSNLGISMYS